MNHGKNLSSPMTNMFSQPPNGGAQAGDKEGWGVMNELGAPRPAVDEPMLQITEDIGGSLNGRKMASPMGSADKVSGDKR